MRALHRTAQFDPASPSFARVRQRAWKDAARLLRQPVEIGYVVGPPAAAGAPPEIHVDGAQPQRIELRKIVPQSTGGAFVLQLSEYLRRRGLVALAISRGLAEEEWNAALDALAAPPVEDDPAREGERLAKLLVERKVEHLTALPDGEQLKLAGGGAWQIRLALGRLGHELRRQIALGRSTADVLARAPALVEMAVGPLWRRFDVLRAILAEAPALDAALVGQAALRPVAALDQVIRGLPPFALQGVTRAELGESGAAPGEPGLSTLRAIARRLLAEPSTRKGDETLRELARRGVIPKTQLPPALQEWVLAETWVEALAANPGADPPVGGAGSNPSSIMQKAMSYALSSHRFGAAYAVMVRLSMLDPQALPGVFDVPTVVGMAPGLPDDPTGRRGVVALLQAGGATAADALAGALAEVEGKDAEAVAWLLAEMKELGTAAALRALAGEIEKEATVRALLSCLGGALPNDAFPVLRRYVGHAVAEIRRDALGLVAQSFPTAADPLVAQALSDQEESVRVRALLLCARTGVGAGQAVPQAIKLVTEDARHASPEVVKAAIAVIAQRFLAGALPADTAEDALQKLVSPAGVLGRLMGKDALPPEVTLAAIPVLAWIGTPRARKLLEKLSGDDEESVARAAKQALVSPPPRPADGGRPKTPVRGVPARPGTPVQGVPARRGTPVEGVPIMEQPEPAAPRVPTYKAPTPVQGVPIYRAGTPVAGVPAYKTPAPASGAPAASAAKATPAGGVPELLATPAERAAADSEPPPLPRTPPPLPRTPPPEVARPPAGRPPAPRPAPPGAAAAARTPRPAVATPPPSSRAGTPPPGARTPPPAPASPRTPAPSLLARPRTPPPMSAPSPEAVVGAAAVVEIVSLAELRPTPRSIHRAVTPVSGVSTRTLEDEASDARASDPHRRKTAAAGVPVVALPETVHSASRDQIPDARTPAPRLPGKPPSKR